MGIPGVLGGLAAISKDDGILLKGRDDCGEIHHIMLDANAVLHDCRKLLAGKGLADELYEAELVRQFHLMILQIYRYARPTKSLRIMLDGVVPLAKIKEQRNRRVRRPLDDRIERVAFNIQKKDAWDVALLPGGAGDLLTECERRLAPMVEPPGAWNITKISAGTRFMHRLCAQTIDWLETTFPGGPDFMVELSTVYTPGEGEHKILDVIRRGDAGGRYMIVGNDADLFFLMMSCCASNQIYLLRTKNDKKPLSVAGQPHACNASIFDINAINALLLKEVALPDDRERTTSDIITILSLLGNDFLCSLPCLILKVPYPNEREAQFVRRTSDMRLPPNPRKCEDLNPIVLLLKAYRAARLRCDADVCQDSFLLELFRAIDDSTTRARTYQRLNVYMNSYTAVLRHCTAKEAYDGIPADMLASFRKRLLFLSGKPLTPALTAEGRIERVAYYRTFFDMEEVTDAAVDAVVAHYLAGLTWVGAYYLRGCPDWRWCYPYHHPPRVEDVIVFLEARRGTVQTWPTSPDQGAFYGRVRPLHQLMLTLPKDHLDLLPTSLAAVMRHERHAAFFVDGGHCMRSLKPLYRIDLWQANMDVPVIPPEVVIEEEARASTGSEAGRVLNSALMPYAKVYH